MPSLVLLAKWFARHSAIWFPVGGLVLFLTMMLVTQSPFGWSDAGSLVGVLGLAMCWGLGWDTAQRDFEDAWMLLAAAAASATAIFFATDTILAWNNGVSWRWEFLVSFLLMAGFAFFISCVARFWKRF